MNRTLLSMMVLIAAQPLGSMAATQDSGRLPGDVRKLVERFESCAHFAGEFSGDGSERDREVNATMTGLRCDKVEGDMAALRRKYAGRPAVLKALDRLGEL